MNTSNRSRQAGKATIVTIIVAVGLVILAIIMILPALGPEPRLARSLETSSHFRGIHGAMWLFAQGNNNFYPGFNGHDLTSFSTPVDWCQGAQDGRDVSQRFALLLLQNFFTGEYTISAAEAKTIWTQGTVTAAHYSYAMLELPQPPAAPQGSTQPASPTGRLREWSPTMNTGAPVLADRSMVQDPTLKTASVWAKGTKPSDWRGVVGWNDNHVSFESSSVLGTTRFGTKTNTNDDLFTATSDADAMMSYGK